MCGSGAGRGRESWGLNGMSVQALEPKGLEHGEVQAHSARFSRVKLGMGQEAMPDGLCCCLDWDRKAELSIGLGHRALPFGVGKQKLLPVSCTLSTGGGAECNVWSWEWNGAY